MTQAETQVAQAITVEYTRDELVVLQNLLQVAVQARGLDVAEPALVLAKKHAAAVKMADMNAALAQPQPAPDEAEVVTLPKKVRKAA